MTQHQVSEGLGYLFFSNYIIGATWKTWNLSTAADTLQNTKYRNHTLTGEQELEYKHTSINFKTSVEGLRHITERNRY